MKKLILGVGGALFNNGKLLMVKRNADKRMAPNMWEIPGGKVEFSEDPEDALKREFLEETGINVEIVRPYSTWSHVQDAETFYIEIDYVVQCKNAESVKLSSEEHSEYKWAAKNEELKTTSEMQDSLKKAWKAYVQ